MPAALFNTVFIFVTSLQYVGENGEKPSEYSCFNRKMKGKPFTFYFLPLYHFFHPEGYQQTTKSRY
jgi:hypothetical protein